MIETNDIRLRAEHFAAWRKNSHRKEKVQNKQARATKRDVMRDHYLSRLQAEEIRPCPEHCEVCGGKSPHGRVLSWDHNHETGLFRGWLCNWCNVTIGNAKESPDLLRRLADYLERDGLPEVQGA